MIFCEIHLYSFLFLIQEMGKIDPGLGATLRNTLYIFLGIILP